MNNNITDIDHSDDPKLEGLRMTRQRREVYDVLMSLRDHPTASEVYERAKSNMPGISLATVYNCLEALVDHGAVRQVHFERESSRYCPNLTAHGHFQDEQSGRSLMCR
jgi:Fe2+ or Zn2+ uptake regulation protein